MSRLNIDRNLDRPDELYEALINAHAGLTKDESDALNARLILLLVNHIGDEAVLEQAILAAKS